MISFRQVCTFLLNSVLFLLCTLRTNTIYYHSQIFNSLEWVWNIGWSWQRRIWCHCNSSHLKAYFEWPWQKVGQGWKRRERQHHDTIKIKQSLKIVSTFAKQTTTKPCFANYRPQKGPKIFLVKASKRWRKTTPTIVVINMSRSRSTIPNNPGGDYFMTGLTHGKALGREGKFCHLRQMSEKMLKSGIQYSPAKWQQRSVKSFICVDIAIYISYCGFHIM